MDFVIPIQSDSLFFQPVGYRNNINTQHKITLDLEMTGDSSGNIDSTDKKTFITQLRDILVIDRLSDVYLSNVTTQNVKINSTSETSNFILTINEFNIHTSTNQPGLVSKIIIPNNTSADGLAIHKSNKLNYMCTLNPAMLLNLSGSITMNDESTLLIDNAYTERVSTRYTTGTPNTGIVRYKPSGVFGGGSYTEHARQYDQNDVGDSGNTPDHSDHTGDLAYAFALESLTVLASLGGKHIDETDEYGNPAVVPGDILYVKQYVGDGPKKHDELTHATNDRSLVNDYNSDGTVDYVHTESNWTNSEFHSIGQVLTIISDSVSVLYSTTGKMVKFTEYAGHLPGFTYDEKYGKDRPNMSRAVGGTSLWIENTSAATTFRCIIEFVIKPRDKN